MVTFSYTGGGSIELPNPKIGEDWTVGVKTTFGHTMDGTIHSFRYTPASDKFRLNFSNINTLLLDEFITFLEGLLDETLTYIDSYGDEWTVKLLTKNVTFTNEGRAGFKQYRYGFELELEVINE